MSAPAIDREYVVRRLFPPMRRLIARGYFRFEVEGLEHVPREGRVVHVQNHAGWFALDAFFLTFAVAEAYGIRRAPFFATQDAALSTPLLGSFMRRFGAVPASWFRRPDKLPDAIEACGIFPEGVRGNCKPFWDAYRMRDWNRGFVRVAIARQAAIVPAAVLGGEECLPVGWTIRSLEPIIGSLLPLPLSPFPLPTRWKIIFHPPVHLDAPRSALGDQAYCTAVARRIQTTVQRTLDAEAARRPLGKLSSLVGALAPDPPPGEPEDPLAGTPPFPTAR